MKNLEEQKNELMSMITNLGYESLRFSIFNDHRPGEWEVRIEFDSTSEHYFVYATMDRASYNKKLEFDNFEDAKNKFTGKLDLTVKINRAAIKMEKFLNTPLHYGRKSMIDIENMKYIVEQEIKKRHFESLQYVLFDENKRLPWAFHLFYRDGKFMINSRDDRFYVIGNTVEFNSFEEAKADFINTLEKYVEMNIQGKELGFTPEYPLPLWDEDGK